MNKYRIQFNEVPDDTKSIKASHYLVERSGAVTFYNNQDVQIATYFDVSGITLVKAGKKNDKIKWTPVQSFPAPNRNGLHKSRLVAR